MFTAAALMAGLLGCAQDYELTPDNDGYGANDPCIVVTPEVLNFGELARDEHVTQSFDILNDCGGELELESRSDNLMFIVL